MIVFDCTTKNTRLSCAISKKDNYHTVQKYDFSTWDS